MAASIGLALAAGRAAAATYVVDQNIDLTGISTPTGEDWQLSAWRWTPEADIPTVVAGDVLDWTGHFIGGSGYLYTTGPFEFSLRLSTGGDFVWMHTTATIDFLDAQDNVIGSGSTNAKSNAWLGSYFASSDISGIGLDQKIYGFRYHGTVDDLQDLGDGAHYHEAFGFVSGATAVPEPATWAMMIAGFGLVGATLRRRTMRAAQA